MQWFRMYHEFATDPKVQMLSEVDQRRYIMLLCLRCCNGDVTLHETEIAFQLRISQDEWAKTKATLLGKNLISGDGKPTAWDKRQYTSDSSSQRVAKHRASKKTEVKQKCNVTVTPPEAESDTEKKEGKPIFRPTNNHATFREWMKASDLTDLPDGWFALIKALRVPEAEIQPRTARFVKHYTEGKGMNFTSNNWPNEFWKWFAEKPMARA